MLRTIVFALLVGQSLASRPHLDASKLMTEAEHSCDAAQLKKNSKHIGKGGNAFVIRLTKDVCGGKSGEVFKAFSEEDERDEAINVLTKLPEECDLAGLSCSAGDKDNCKLQAPCVNSEWTDVFPESSTCYYMRTAFGGSTTLEQCAEKGTNVRGLMVSAVQKLQCIHSKGWYHNDYQLKNIMTSNKCNSDKVKVIDLDGMADKAENTKAPGAFWGAEHRAWRDYIMLFGSCDMGATPIDELVPAKDKDAAKKMRDAAEKEMGCKWDESKTWDDMLKLGTAIEKAVEAA